jgi:hypothetical protein
MRSKDTIRRGASVGPQTVFGSSPANFVFGAATAGVQTFSTSSALFAFGEITQALRKTFGVVSAPFTSNRTTAAVRKTFSNASAAFTVSIVTNGQIPGAPVGPTSGMLLLSYTPGTDRNDFTGAVGVRLGIGAADIPVTWIGLRSNGYGGTRTVKIYEWFSGVVQRTITIDYTGISAGQYAWTQITPFNLRDGKLTHDEILMDTVAFDGNVWKNPDPVSYKPSYFTNIYGSYNSGGLAVTGGDESFVGIDLAVSVPAVTYYGTVSAPSTFGAVTNAQPVPIKVQAVACTTVFSSSPKISIATPADVGTFTASSVVRVSQALQAPSGRITLSRASTVSESLAAPSASFLASVQVTLSGAQFVQATPPGSFTASSVVRTASEISAPKLTVTMSASSSAVLTASSSASTVTMSSSVSLGRAIQLPPASFNASQISLSLRWSAAVSAGSVTFSSSSSLVFTLAAPAGRSRSAEQQNLKTLCVQFQVQLHSVPLAQ